MKLILKNFRCHIEKEFDFGENGLVLLSGHSGQGKSTIMMAILFALYGSGNKLATSGKTALEVYLEINDICITRTKRPNHLTLINNKTNETFEDDSAQAFIDEHFGKAFETTSYIRQNAINSFVVMSPTDKLEFLEKFAIEDLGQIKTKCNMEIKKRNEQLTISSSQLDLASQYLQTLSKPKKVVCKYVTEKAIDNQRKKLHNSKVLIKRKEREIQGLKEEISETRIYNSQISSKKQLLDSLLEKHSKLVSTKESINYEGDHVLLKYENDLKNHIKQKELLYLINNYEKDNERLLSMIQVEKDEMKKDLDSKSINLWEKGNEEETKETIDQYTLLEDDAKEYKKLKDISKKYENIDTSSLEKNKSLLEETEKDLEKNKELLQKITLQKELQKCPSCDASLRVVDNSLVLYEEHDNCEIQTSEETLKNNIKKDTLAISRLEAKILETEKIVKKREENLYQIKEIEDKYEEPIPDRDDIISYLKEIKVYYDSQKTREKDIKEITKKLKNEIFSPSVESFKSELKNQKKKIIELQKIYKNPIDINEEEVRDKISCLKRDKEKSNDLQKNISIYEKEISEVQISIEKIKNKFKYSGKDVDEMNKTLLSFESQLAELKKEEENYTKINENIVEYIKYTDELKKYKDWSEKVETLKEDEIKSRERLSACTLLKEKIKEAESLAITNIINSINLHAQEYLDIFFPTDPIVVRLLPFKESKKKNVQSKPQINMEIDYKGMEADITMLSGGELARVVLAYTLALAEIFNSSLLLLDECTASLDQESTSIVMEGIRKNFSNKLVIVIAHQVVSGDFDRQITL